MIEISIYAFGHEWYKLNLVTLKDNKGLYDLMKCKNCGIKGKRYSLNSIHIYERYLHMLQCPVKYDQIKIIHTNAFGKQFENLTDGSIHDIIDPPEGFTRERGIFAEISPYINSLSNIYYISKFTMLLKRAENIAFLMS